MDRKYVDIQWLVKIKTDSKGDVHYEKWSQPSAETVRHVLTKPKILTVPIELQEDLWRVIGSRVCTPICGMLGVPCGYVPVPRPREAARD